MKLEEVRQAAFRDELDKIAEAELSLVGVSPEMIAQVGRPAPPMETSALAKALAVLNRLDLEKTASPSIPTAVVPGMNDLSGSKKRKKTTTDQAKSFGAHSVGGMASGQLAARLSAGPAGASNRRQWWGMALGGAAGAAMYGHKRLAERYTKHLEKKRKTAAVVGNIRSPGLALEAARKTAVPKLQGSTPTGGRFMGRKFRIPSVGAQS